MDEPTAQLTMAEVENLYKIIATLKAKDTPIIFISHRMEELFTVTDRVTIMRDGQYVTTVNTAETDRDQLIILMVGRELKSNGPRTSYAANKVALKVEHVSGYVNDDCSFELEKGEILGVSGLVGAGRTELMRYEVFDKESIQNDPGYQSQEHMEKIYREATRPSAEERISLNDSLSPLFLSCSWEDKTLRLLYHNRPWMLNTNGHMHGGMIASVCDMTMGILVRYLKGTNNCVTVSLDIEYMRGISADEDITVEAAIEKAGRNITFLSAKVYRMSDGKPAARASATFM